MELWTAGKRNNKNTDNSIWLVLLSTSASNDEELGKATTRTVCRMCLFVWFSRCVVANTSYCTSCEDAKANQNHSSIFGGINSTVKERAERLWRGMYAAERFNNSPTCRGGENKQKTPIPFDEGGGYNFILGNVGYWSKELSVLFLLPVRMSVTLSGCQSVILPSRLRMSKKIISFRESTSDYDKLFSRALWLCALK